MREADLLCRMDAVVMRRFSQASILRMKKLSPLVFSLPLFPAFARANVDKEIDKDHLIIREAAAAFAVKAPLCDLDVERIFEETKRVDRVFLRKLPLPSFLVTIRYHEIAGIRIHRIGCIAGSVYRLLECWSGNVPFAAVVRSAYTPGEFTSLLAEILRLYCDETRTLSRALPLLPPVQGMVASVTEHLFRAMEESTAGITTALTARLYGSGGVHG